MAQLTIVQPPPSSVRHGTHFDPPPTVQVLDGAGNGISGASVKASLNNPLLGTGKLSGPLTVVTAPTGLATFLGLSISKAALLAYTITFTSGGVSTTSTGITIN